MNGLKLIGEVFISERATHFYKIAWKAFTGSIMMLVKALPILLFLVLLYDYFHQNLVIRPFTVTKTLEEHGLTDVVAAEELRQQIYTIKQEVSLNERTSLGIALTEELPDITVPTTGVSINSIFDAFSDVLPWSPRTIISGAFTDEDGTTQLTIFVDAKQVYKKPLSRNDGLLTPDDLITDAAGQVIEQINPLWRAEYLFDKHRLAEATDILTSVINREQRPDDSVVEAHVLLGRIFHERRDDSNACAQFTQALNLNPANGDAYRHLSQMLADEGRQDLAMDDAGRAVILTAARDPWSFYMEGNRYFDNKDWQDAEFAYSRALDLWFSNRFAHDALGRVYEERNDPNAAEKEFEIASAFGRNGRDAQALDDMGELMLAENRFDSALEDFAEAQAADSEYFIAYDHLGALYFKVKKYRRAADEFYSALRAKKEDDSAFIAFKAAIAHLPEVNDRQNVTLALYLLNKNVCSSRSEKLAGIPQATASEIQGVAQIRCQLLKEDPVVAAPTEACVVDRSPFELVSGIEMMPSMETWLFNSAADWMRGATRWSTPMALP